MNKKTIEKIIERFNIDEICQLLDNDSEKNIAELKLYDFLVDVRGNGKFDEKIEILKNNLKTDVALNYIQELKIINRIFIECSKLQNQINVIPPKRVLPLMLYWSSYFIDEYKTSKAEEELKKNNSDRIIAYEKKAELTIQAIKSLLHNEKLFDGKKFIHKFNSIYYLNNKNQKLIIDYITNSYNASHWFEKYNYWKKGAYEICIINDCEIKLNIKNKSLLELNTNIVIKEKINRTQYESKALAEYQFKNTEKPKHNIEFMEFISQKILDKHFYCLSEDLLIKNVKIKHWIKAYFTLHKLSKTDIDTIMPSSFISAGVLDHIKCKSKNEWIKIFIKEGIPLESAKIIFEHLIFNKNSTDLYDYPFIPVGNKYLISRTISKYIHPALSIISRFNSKDINIDIKGENFEKNLYSFFDMMKIPYTKLHNKVDGYEYECDAVFYLDNTFVFCECKNRSGHKLEAKDSNAYIEDSNQLKRISNFYKENMNLVFNAFALKGIKIKDKKFYKTKDIVIHSRAVDGVIYKDDVYIMDFDNFIMPFDRGSIFEDYINDPKIRKIFQGDVNIYKLFKFYDYDFCVYDYRNKIIYKDNEIQLGNIKLYIEDYHISDFFNEELFEHERRIHIKNLFRQAGMSEINIKEIINKYL